MLYHGDMKKNQPFRRCNMDYSVEDLAQISGVSVRTLHYYDEIGLLEPAIRMANGRRYYGVKQLLLLQEILYFKKTGFSLKKIKPILELDYPEKSKALARQKQILLKEIKSLKRTVKSIDRTILHYQGNKMSEEEICEQYENVLNKAKDYEKFCEKKFGKNVIDDIKKHTEALNKDKEFIEERAEEMADFFEKIVAAVNDGISEDSPEAQALMQQHYEGKKKTRPSTIPKGMAKEMYLDGREMMCKEYRDVFAQLHPKLPDFLYKAMGVFAAHKFPENDS